jgi:hypothetical protein
MRAFLEGLLYAVLLVALVLGAMVMAGCATGVQMTDEERVACRDSGCAAWTETELRTLVDRAVGAGYRKGWTDVVRQSGANL